MDNEDSDMMRYRPLPMVAFAIHRKCGHVRQQTVQELQTLW
jgi:hypothetical protein